MEVFTYREGGSASYHCGLEISDLAQFCLVPLGMLSGVHPGLQLDAVHPVIVCSISPSYLLPKLPLDDLGMPGSSGTRWLPTGSCTQPLMG